MVDQLGPRAIRNEEIPECLAMLDKAFTFTPDGYFAHYFEGDPWFKNDYCRVYPLDGRIVSAVNICRREVRVGSVTLTLGGIGNVGTAPEHRGQGYSSQVLRDAIQVMKADEMDFSVLYTGIHGFYERLGWRTLPIPFITGKLKSAKRDADETRYVTREYERDDAAAILRIYDSFNSGLTMSAVRTEPYWRGFCMHEFRPPSTISLAEDASGPVAYTIARIDKSTLVFDELGLLPGHDVALRLLMKEAANLALLTRATEIRVEPITHPDVTAAAPHIADHLELHNWNYGMVAFFDLKRTFNKLLPELTERIKESGSPGSVTIETEIGSIGLKSDGKQVTLVGESDTQSRAKLTQPDLARLIFGWGPAQDADSEVSESAKPFVAAMFPPRPFVYWQADMF